MKKIILAVFAMFSCMGAFAQEQASSAQYIYCELVGQEKFLSSKVTVSIDYGQSRSFFADKRLRDEDGKVKTFNSMVDAMNYLGADGWEFQQAYVVTMGNQNVYHWLLRFPIAKLSDEERAAVLKDLSTYKPNKN